MMQLYQLYSQIQNQQHFNGCNRIICIDQSKTLPKDPFHAIQGQTNLQATFNTKLKSAVLITFANRLQHTAIKQYQKTYYLKIIKQHIFLYFCQLHTHKNTTRLLFQKKTHLILSFLIYYLQQITNNHANQHPTSFLLFSTHPNYYFNSFNHQLVNSISNAFKNQDELLTNYNKLLGNRQLNTNPLARAHLKQCCHALHYKFYQLPAITIQSYMKLLIFALIMAAVLTQETQPTDSIAAETDKIVKPCLNPDYNCLRNSGAYFNPTTCRCECNQACDCKNKLQQWQGYPTCQCLCKKIAKCSELQYWYDPTCSCRCKYQIICFNPLYWQDPNTCQCVCRPVDCKPGYYQDPSSCKCVKSNCWPPKTCPNSQNFNIRTCGCQ